MKFEWELIYEMYEEYTHRAKVKGGWLVRCCCDESIAITFVPDEHYTWKVEVEE